MQPQSNSTAMQTQQPQNAQNAQNANSRTAPALLPPVDIYEDSGGITLCADLPGVTREDLAIGVDGRNLTIEETGWALFRCLLAVASGERTCAERLGLHNALVLFNPAPVT